MKYIFSLMLFITLVSGCVYNSPREMLTNTVRVQGSSGTIISVSEFTDKLDQVLILTAAHVVSSYVPVFDIGMFPSLNISSSTRTSDPNLNLPDLKIDPNLLGRDKNMKVKFVMRLIPQDYAYVEFFEIDKYGNANEFLKKRGDIVYFNHIKDLACICLYIPKGKIKYTLAKEGEAGIGDILYAASCAAKDTPTLVKGNFAGVIRKDNFYSVFAGGVSYGCSGGGIYTEEGKLVGIILGVRVSEIPLWYLGLYRDIRGIEGLIKSIKEKEYKKHGVVLPGPKLQRMR